RWSASRRALPRASRTNLYRRRSAAAEEGQPNGPGGNYSIAAAATCLSRCRSFDAPALGMEPDSTHRELEQPLRGWFFVRGRLLRQPHLPAGGPVPVDWSHCRAWLPCRACPPCAVRGRRHAVSRGGVFDLPAYRRCDGMGLSALSQFLLFFERDPPRRPTFAPASLFSGYGAEMGDYCGEIIGSDGRIIVVAHWRFEFAAVAADALGDRATDLVVGPGANALFLA